MFQNLSLLKTWVEISKSSLKNNIEAVKNLNGKKLLMGVVKSNAYGHGLIGTANFFLDHGVNWLGVDNVAEAVDLRNSGMKKNPILVLGYTPPALFSLAAKYNLRLALYGKDVFVGASSSLKKNLNFHLKIDSGMSRQGILLSDLSEYLKFLKTHDDVKVEGVFTHFANADELSDLSYPRKQLDKFNKALKIIRKHGFNPSVIHASATTAFFSLPESNFDLNRIGIAFYGLWPSKEFKRKFGATGLTPALSWKTRIIQIKKIAKGTPVGYGITERVKRNSLIAVLPVGYYDGFSRSLSSVGEVLIGGKRCKILGRISMNLSVVDISGAPETRVWDEAVLIGKQAGKEITAEEVAEKIGTISYEVVSRINPLLPRFYL